MNLSNHLSLQECTTSYEAKRRGLTNQPNDHDIEALKNTAEKIFEPIRIHFGVPIFVSCGYRSPALNLAIGGAPSSQHTKGEALDLDQDGMTHGITNKMVFDYIKDHMDFDQLIWEFGDKNNPSWVHVSCKLNGTNRKEVLRSIRINGDTIYQKYS